MCQCCSLGLLETDWHSSFECPAYDVQRKEFLELLDAVHDGFSSLDPESAMTGSFFQVRMIRLPMSVYACTDI